ncbi:MAG: glycoside hydrolase family 55 protein [Polyangiaceae bacterium]|nr:glycoside hydrolase family 55 protein [Polyangiaceae bacterium]
MTSPITSIDGIDTSSTTPLQGTGAQGSDIILLKDQSDATENGLYWVNTSGAQVRCSEPLIAGRAITVGGEGATNAHAQYVLPQAGNIIQLGQTGITVSRQNVINVKDFGAKGDGATPDDAAIQAAVAAFELAAATTWPSGFTSGGPTLYFPAGAYFTESPIVVSGVHGCTIRGDGPRATVIIGSGSAFYGARALLQLRSCAHVVTRDLTLRGPQYALHPPANINAGDTSFTVSDIGDPPILSIGQRIALWQPDSSAGEIISVANVSGTTITTASPVRYDYTVDPNSPPTSAYVLYGAVFGWCSYQDMSGATQTTANLVENVTVGDDGSSVECMIGFGWDMKGGGPATITANAAAGQPTVTVTDASQLYVGLQVQIWVAAFSRMSQPGDMTEHDYFTTSTAFSTAMSSRARTRWRSPRTLGTRAPWRRASLLMVRAWRTSSRDASRARASSSPGAPCARSSRAR